MSSTPIEGLYPTEPALALPAERPAAAPKQPRRWPEWLREPLLHFIVLGGALFALDHYLLSRSDNPNLIVVGAEVDSEALHQFEKLRGRHPTDQERRALHRVWLDNEVLYREGLAMGVDKGDPAIRERVIFKALSVIDNNVKLPAPDAKTIRAWFESRREKYDEPARFDFEEGALAGSSDEQAARDFVAALNAGAPGDAKAGLRVYKARPRPNLLESFGPEFTAALEAAPVGVWQALKTREGWRAIKLNAISPPKPAVFEAIVGPVTQDWKDALASEQRSAAVKAMAKKYEIRFEESAHECND